MLQRITLGLCVLMLLAACDSEVEPLFPSDLEDFATRYAAAWSGQDPAVWAAFYADDAIFQINDGEVSVGRGAIEETARSFMAGFPDMVIQLVEVKRVGDIVEFHWHWTGTYTGPGGNGASVDLRGFEEWSFNSHGLIQSTHGNMDDAEYQRQLGAGDT